MLRQTSSSDYIAVVDFDRAEESVAAIVDLEPPARLLVVVAPGVGVTVNATRRGTAAVGGVHRNRAWSDHVSVRVIALDFVEIDKPGDESADG